MSWLIGSTIASMVGALFVVRLFDYLLLGLFSGLAGAVKLGLFVGVWTMITVGTGMRTVQTRVRSLRGRIRL